MAPTQRAAQALAPGATPALLPPLSSLPVPPAPPAPHSLTRSLTRALEIARPVLDCPQQTVGRARASGREVGREGAAGLLEGLGLRVEG